MTSVSPITRPWVISFSIAQVYRSGNIKRLPKQQDSLLEDRLSLMMTGVESQSEAIKRCDPSAASCDTLLLRIGPLFPVFVTPICIFGEQNKKMELNLLRLPPNWRQRWQIRCASVFLGIFTQAMGMPRPFCLP